MKAIPFSLGKYKVKSLCKWGLFFFFWPDLWNQAERVVPNSIRSWQSSRQYEHAYHLPAE